MSNKESPPQVAQCDKMLANFHGIDASQAATRALSHGNYKRKIIIALWFLVGMAWFSFWSFGNSLPFISTTTITSVRINWEATANDKQKQQRFFVLYVGPPKTATTTFQKYFTHLERVHVLEQDNYAFLGRRDPNYKV